jgi:hypothetical protein
MVAGLSNRELDLRGGSEGWSVREYVHHLVEANLVVGNVVLVALGKPGHVFDWSWLWPSEQWMKQMGYDRAPVEPAIDLLEKLCAHVAGLIRLSPAEWNSSVALGGPGSRTTRRKLGEVVREEVEHARHHLEDVSKTLKAHRRR